MHNKENPLPFDGQWLRGFRRRLMAWFDRNAREMPWRGTRDPYAIWVSEIMLQQTQVETVKPYFQRFMATLPTIAALAAADEQQVLRLWEGLGYYRRARQLHAAARRIVAEHDGRFPTDPGGGRTAAGHWPLHGRRDPLHRLRSTAADPRSKYDAAFQPAVSLRRPNHDRCQPEATLGRSRSGAADARCRPL